MPKFLITAPDGKKYRVTGPTKEGALAALKKQMGAEPKPAASKNDAAVYGLTDTMGFGFADEVGSGIAAGVGKLTGDPRSMSEIYNETLTRGRGMQKAAQEAHPGDYLAGQGVGAVVTAPIGGPLVKGAQGLKALWQSAKAGGIAGGVYGFGSGEGGLEQRVNEAGKGALLGGTVGAALPVVAKGAGAAYKGVKNLAQGADSFAAEKVAQAADRAGVDPTVLPRELSDNPNMIMADALGKSGQRLSRAVINKGGEGAERLFNKLAERQRGQGERATSAVRSGLGDPASYYGSMETALDKLKKNAEPIYKASYGKKINYEKHGPALTAVWQRVPDRLKPQIMQAANDLLVADGKKMKAMKKVFGRDAKGRVTAQPSVEQWDYIKRGIDRIIEGEEGQAASGGISSFGRALAGVKNDLLNVLDEAVPEYKMARKVYSDDLSVKKALESGREALTLDPELITQNLSKLDAAAKEMYRAGFARALGDQIGGVRTGNNVIDRIWNTPNQQARLKAVFGDKQRFEKFAEFAKGEQKMADTWRAASGNSTTAQQLNDIVDAGNPVVDFASRAATSGTREAIMDAIMKWGRTLGGLTEQRANAIADILMSQGPSKDLQAAIAKRELTNSQKAALTQLIGPSALLAVANGPKGPQ